jgi:hypothetical protein
MNKELIEILNGLGGKAFSRKLCNKITQLNKCEDVFCSVCPVATECYTKGIYTHYVIEIFKTVGSDE